MAKTWVAVVLSVMLLVSLNSGPILADEQPTVGQRTDSAVAGVSNAFKEHGGSSDAVEAVSSTAKCGDKAKHIMGVKPMEDPPPAGSPLTGAAKPAEKSTDKPTRRLTDKPGDKHAGGGKTGDKPAGRPTNKPAGKTANKPTEGSADKPARGPAVKEINGADADQVQEYLESLEHKEGKKSKKSRT